MFLFPFLVACSGNDNPEWIQADNGIKMYVTDTVGTFLAEKAYLWEGDSVCGLAHGKGKLTIIDKDDGKVLLLKEIKAYYGNLDETIIDEVLNEKNPYYYYGDIKDDKKNGFGVLINSGWIYVGDFEDDEGDGMVSVFKNDTLIYVGEWSESSFQGEGKEFYPNGKIKYDGHWSKNAYDGSGVYYDENGTQHKHVWKDGMLPESVSLRYSLLEKNKEKIDVGTYAELKESYYVWEKAHVWIYIGLVLVLCLLFRVLSSQYDTRCEKKYNEIKPLKKKSLYLRWAFGGMWGWHRAYLCSRVCYAQFALFVILLISCVDNISMYILYPSVWFLLPQWNIVTKLSFFLVFAWWIIDALWIPYGRYLYISKFFRRNEYELDILKGNVTQVESFYYNLSKTIDQRNISLEKYLTEARECASEVNPAENWEKKIGVGLDFEKKKFEKMKKICNEMNSIYHTFEDDTLRIQHYLVDARIAAVRNLYLAKELIQIVHSLKGKKQTLQHDDLDILDISIDLSMPDMELDIENMVQKTVQTAMTTYSLILKSGMGKKTAMTGGVITAVALGAIDYISNRNEQRETLAKKSIELVDSMKEAMDKVMQSQAQMLRASELLSALYNANKAFVSAYAGLRDLCFGEVSFRNFWNGAVKESETYETDEFKQSMQHLISVCNEYNKINKQTLKNNHEDI